MSTPAGPGGPGHDPRLAPERGAPPGGQPGVPGAHAQPPAGYGEHGGAPTATYPGAYYGGPQQYGGDGGHDGPSVAERAHAVADTVGRHVKTPETKEFFKASEFWVWALTTLGILLAADAIGGGRATDYFSARQAWLYVAIVSAAYIVSRGIAKAGTRRGYGNAPFDQDSGGGARFQRGGGY